uniref:NADH-ubiquinone oxidoreductase chain 5 n=1 Tax=Trogoderma variabile TaxID=888089 RepID=A0A7D5TIN8_9COLE|nr:NADH dehydrogenase subunit 5 [Trogoderma variabile]
MSLCFIYFMLFLFFSFLSFFLSVIFIGYDYSLILEFVFFNLQSCSLVMTVLFDWMSLLFMSFVFFISSMVIFYSEEYMSGDLFINRFILLVCMFVLSMMLLIISPNLISILLGWDGLGLVSYCLVIYYQNVKSYGAGMLTALTNRIGDVALLISIGWMINFGGWNYVFWLDLLKGDYVMQWISFLVVLAAMTKSAQIPFSSWLPAAMAAPTPVSSLVHSSTLVTAGVYLLIRFSSCLGGWVLYLLVFFSTLTMFMAGLGANYENDLKKIVAMSTLSQLGLMIGILSLGEWKLAFFHLLTHALFKALLFMCSGNYIHNFLDCQDIRMMGGLVIRMPVVCTLFNICNLSLCGIPFLSGFYSKDLLLEVLSMDYLNVYVYLIFFLSTGLTISYTFRLIYYTMFGDYNFMSFGSLGDYGSVMMKGMFGLIFFVVMSGSFLMWLIFPTPCFICLPLFAKFMTLFVLALGCFLGYLVSNIGFFTVFSFVSSYYFFGSMWNMPYFSTIGVSYYPLELGSTLLKNLDLGWSEYFGGQNIYFTMTGLGGFLQFIYMNSLKLWFLSLVFFIILLFFLF